MTPIIESAVKVFANLGEIMSPSLENIKGAAAAMQSFVDGYKRQLETVGIVADRYGWAVPTWAVSLELADLASTDAPDQAEADRMLLATFSPGGRGYGLVFEEMLPDSDYAKHREAIVSEAQRAIEAGMYFSAVSLLVQTSEGMLIDWAHDNMPHNGGVPNAPMKTTPELHKQLKDDENFAPLAEAALLILGHATGEHTIFGTSTHDTLPVVRHSDRLLRHGIAHGVACGYGTEVNAAKSVALAGFVTELVHAADITRREAISF